jgi:hypothetical protein
MCVFFTVTFKFFCFPINFETLNTVAHTVDSDSERLVGNKPTLFKFKVTESPGP